jgi:hypothetical protein
MAGFGLHDLTGRLGLPMFPPSRTADSAANRTAKTIQPIGIK